MSCQQVSKPIPITTSIALLPEDPYVFTETVPTTPPILFNTQKSRARLIDTQLSSATTTTTTTTTATAQPPATTPTATAKSNTATLKLPLAQLNGNATAVANVAGAATTTIPTATTKAKTQTHSITATTTSIKHLTQSQRQQLQQNKRIATNVCIVRPQQQQQQQQQRTQQVHKPQQQQLLHAQKQQSPPPLLSHTPSLWQTPLLLDAAPAVASAPISPTPKLATAAGAVTAATTTALVIPLVAATAEPLPPSKFHHTTLAQHLEKVQCIKKPKKAATVGNSNSITANVSVVACSKQQSPSPPQLLDAQSAYEPPQHSENDLNEIPVNVIFRKPQHATNELQQRTLHAADVSAAKENEEQTLKTMPPTAAAGSPTTTAATTIAATIATPTEKLKNVKIITPLKAKITTLTPTPNAGTQTTTPTPKQGVLKEVVFVQPQKKCDGPAGVVMQNITQGANKHTNTSSMLPLQTCKSDAAAVVPTMPTLLYSAIKTDKVPVAQALLSITPTHAKNAPKRNSKVGLLSPFAQRKGRKGFPLIDCARLTDCQSNSTAVAIVKMSAAQVDADTTVMSSAVVLPYCLQRHWLSVHDLKAYDVVCGISTLRREERIAQQKSILRRQALQLLATHSLQKLPLQASRRRLLCVDRLLRKYQNHSDIDLLPVKQCIIHACGNNALELASHCRQHITNNNAQHVFLPCTAKFADNTQCRIPVFDITHDLPLCTEHARKRDAYNRTLHEQRPRKLVANSCAHDESYQQQQQLQQQQQQSFYSSNNNNKKAFALKTNATTIATSAAAATTQTRKRKLTGVNPVGRPTKRAHNSKKTPNSTTATTMITATPTIATIATTPPPLSAVLKRKSSTTSLESIASNSHSSSSQPQPTMQQQYVVATTLAPPALAPLSNNGNNIRTTQRMLDFGTSAAVGANATMSNVASDLQAHEINQIVAQFAMVANSNNNANFGGNVYQNSCNNNNNNSMQFLSNHNNNTSTDSNFTSLIGSTSSLPSTDELLTQDMLSICENSSAYASSEDTGLGGLSETELMAGGGAHDADDIPLADTRLLEEHDLANVLSALPEDAFNELFTAVRQDERDEVERALELADKHLKTLQQTIGSDSDFLDFLDVNDDMLTDADICSKMEILSSAMHSPETTVGIDNSSNAAMRYIDGGVGLGAGIGTSNVGGSTVGACQAAVADIRGLLQT